MLQSFTVKNFRCFKELTLAPLDRVNLIAGKNNSGKTARLEALDLYGNEGNPQEVFRLNQARGIPHGRATNEQECLWLFPERGNGRPVKLRGAYADNREAFVKLWLFQAGPRRSEGTPEDQEAIKQLGAEDYFTRFPHLVAHSIAADGSPKWSICRLGDSPQGRLINPPGNRWSCLYLSASQRFAPLDLEWFSQLEVAGRQEELLTVLRHLEPRLKRLTLLVLEGEPGLYGDTGQSRLVPLTFMGEGMQRVLSFILAIIHAAGGMVLIDEIENGLHHSTMKRVWQEIAHAARQVDVQVFATTHSYECIQAAHQAFMESETYDLRLFRLDRVDSEIRAAAYNQATLETSVDMNLDVR